MSEDEQKLLREVAAAARAWRRTRHDRMIASFTDYPLRRKLRAIGAEATRDLQRVLDRLEAFESTRP
jgi:hypothetical protein